MTGAGEPSATGPEAAAEGASWDALARAAAETGPGGDAEAEELVRELLVFRLDGDPYAVPVERVREIVRLRPITPVPRVPSSILGVISLRGEVVQVLDLRRRLGLQADPPRRTHRIVVLHGEDGTTTGLLVDGVTQVLRAEEEALRPPAAGESEAVSGLCVQDDRFISLLHLERVLDLGG